MPRSEPDRHAELFASHRRELLGASYRILGRVAAAEDAVQETWLRWAEVELDRVREPRAYLLQAVTRQSLNALRHESRLRESYVGPWLPEPLGDLGVIGAAPPDDPGATAEVAEAVSLAMLVVLESLSPSERAGFILREVFGLSFDEVGAALGRSDTAARQLVHRARAHVRERAPRHPVDPVTHRAVTERFLDAARGGSIDEVLSLLAPDVVLVSDGGGARRAALKPITSVEKVARFLFGILERPDASVRFELGEMNGEAAILAVGDDGVDTAVNLVLDGGLVTRLLMVRNPAKLAHVARAARE